MSEIESIQLELFDLQRRVTDLTVRLQEMKRQSRLANVPAIKKCPKCLAPKDRKEFYLDARYKDGLYPYCRICKAEYYRRRKAA